MQPLTLRWFLFVSVLACYVSAVAFVLYSLVTIQSDRYGDLAVEQVSLVSSSDDNFLHIVGIGITSSVRAVVLPEPEVAVRQFFLDGNFTRGLWFDGQTLLASYQANLLLCMQVDTDNTIQVLGSLRMPGLISQITKVGKRVLVSSGKNGFLLVDLTDPALPTLIGKVPGSPIWSTTHRDFRLSGQRVYAVDRKGQLFLIDMALAEPKVKTFPVDSSSWRVALHGERLATGSLNGAVELFDLDFEGIPHAVGRIQFDGGVRGLQLTDTGLFVALGNGELHLFDTTSWPQPQRRSIQPLGGQILDVVSLPERSQLLVSRSLRGLLSIDVSDLTQPQVGRNFPLVSSSREACIAGGLLASLSSRNLSVHSVSQVLAGHDKQPLPLDGYDQDIYTLGDKAYLLSLPELREGQNVGSIPHPVLRSVESLCERGPGQCAEAEHERIQTEQTCLVMAENYQSNLVHVFCRETEGGLPQWQTTLDLKIPSKAFWNEGRIYSISQDHSDGERPFAGTFRVYNAAVKSNPLHEGELVLPGTLYALAWFDPHFVLVAAGTGGLYVVDVADPTRPAVASHLSLPRHLSSFALVTNVISLGSTVYLAHRNGRLSQLDLSTPNSPRIVQVLDVPGHTRKMTVKDGMLIASLYQDGVYIVDVGNGDRWAPVGQLELPISVFDLQACSDKLFVSGGKAGLMTLPLPLRLSVRPQGQRHTRITLPSDLEPGNYHLYLYNETENLRVKSAFRIEAQKE